MKKIIAVETKGTENLLLNHSVDRNLSLIQILKTVGLM